MSYERYINVHVMAPPAGLRMWLARDLPQASAEHTAEGDVWARLGPVARYCNQPVWWGNGLLTSIVEDS